ncbi:Na-translocating system protein MpsC family protein [Neobacillus dielmonensis]|uniref:Na-translocating system protein MpsC family protein n=1 Tax=Neobacillus dielmonensis TaxID=1347369 RepID=UPI0018A87045|nr:Na-translocating system protein MpsC family protein [Neobacillus dielmonensis]
MFSKLVKRRFGKGPETCYVSLKGMRLYVYLKSYLTPAEEVLLESDELYLAHKFRSKVINAVIKEFIPEVSEVLGVEFDRFYHDWNCDTNTGMILLENGFSNDVAKIDMPFERELAQLIEKVGMHYHKSPSQLKVVKYTHNICAIELKEVLSQLEELVFKKGNMDLLLYQSIEIKRGYMMHKIQFEDLFPRIIEDLFMLWDYENDRNYLVFVFTR